MAVTLIRCAVLGDIQIRWKGARTAQALGGRRYRLGNAPGIIRCQNAADVMHKQSGGVGSKGQHDGPDGRIERDGSSARARDLTGFIVQSVAAARAVETPFYHLEFNRGVPENIDAAMLAAMPSTSDYRRMSGRRKVDVREDGTPTRVKIDLFPEYIRSLPPEKRQIWDLVGRALCAREVQAAFVRRLAPTFARRFGPGYADVGLNPLPILTRDVPGYSIHPHANTRSKGITVQLYLPRDEAHINIGTIFHKRQPDGSLTRDQMRFAPNTGYAFTVDDESLHSADPVGPEVTTRDSILLTYFVDAGVLRVVRNRGKRLGNFVLNEVRLVGRR